MRPRTALLVGAILLAGCAKAAAPVAKATPQLVPGEQGQAAPDVPAIFAPLIAHVRSRATLWREGAPIKSLVMDDRQSVLRPLAVDCQQRQPVVLIDADPDKPEPMGALEDMLATPGWSAAARAVRDMDVGIIWISSRTGGDALRARLIATGLDPMARDRVATPRSDKERKQDVRLHQARTHCVLAVVGDTRGDADEAYHYLRSADTVLPIDENWGAGWFLLPAPMTVPEVVK
jgi:hypothetical protein